MVKMGWYVNMVTYAAIDSQGRRLRSNDRQEIDRWAAARCSDGCSVDIYAATSGSGRNQCDKLTGSELVGRWEPIGDV